MYYATGLTGWQRGLYPSPVYPQAAPYAAPYQAPDQEQEKQALKNQAEALQSEMDFIKKRLGELETGTAAE